MAQDKGNNSQPLIMNGGAGVMEAPKGLLDGISEIEFIYATELRGADLPEMYFTTKNRLIFYELGFRTTLVSGLVMSLMVPIAIGVLEKNIPIFGSNDPSLFDQIFVLFISVSYMIGYAAFIGWGVTKHKGPYSTMMVKNLLSGVTMAALTKAAIMFVFFNFCYMVLFTQSSLLKIFVFLQNISGSVISHEKLEKAYLWTLEFRDSFLWSAWYVVVTTLLYLAWIYFCYWKTKFNNKKQENKLAA